MREVHRNAIGIPAQAQLPAVCILSADVSKTQRVSATECKLAVTLFAAVEASIDLADAVDKIEADIEKAIATDPTFGGIAMDAYVVGTSEAINEEIPTMGGTAITLEIVWRHRVGDPYQAA